MLTGENLNKNIKFSFICFYFFALKINSQTVAPVRAQVGSFASLVFFGAPSGDGDSGDSEPPGLARLFLSCSGD
jgi:hypothetical protein